LTTTEIEAPPPAPPEPKPAASAPPPRRKRTGVGNYITTASILVLGGYVVVPMGILLILSFNTATDILVDPPKWGLSNWTDTWQDPKILPALGNSVLIWFLVAVISFPVSIGISLLLARTQLPFARALELGFWVAFIFPPLASVIGWMMLASPDWGFANVAINAVFGLSGPGPLNIYSVPGIVWTRLMTDGIAFQVILLTPAFRNMNGALEEAGRVSGSSGIRTMFRVTLPVMVAPIAMVLALQVIKVFQGFEVEWLLGARWGFFVFSSLIYQMVSLEPVPQYAHAIVLASVTLLIIAAVIPIQNWIVNRRPYTTVTGSFKPGLINLRGWKWPTFGVLAGLLFTLTVLPAVVLTIGSFMARVGFFNTTPLWTLAHWQYVFGDPGFQEALRTTLILACAAGFICPFLFSILAYILVRTTWRGRTILDSIIWGSAALPGILLGLGLLLMFLITPGVSLLFGTIWPLLFVAILSGKTTGVNVFKGVLVQLGAELEEASRTSGAGWFRTYFRVVVPILTPTMVLIGMMNFVSAANMVSSIVLLASRETKTLSILALEYGGGQGTRLEEAGIISLLVLVLTMGVALPIRVFARRLGVRHDLPTQDGA
jgi:iron(III) transport system permease protein